MVTFVTCLTLLAMIVAETAPTPPPEPPVAVRSARVRTADPRTAKLLVQGLQRSDTIRRLVSELEQREVIAYLAMQPALRKGLAGTLTWITATPTHRYVRISISPDMSTDMAIATLGHELQHALEVASAPEIVDARTLEQFYREHGDVSQQQTNGWDTEAARLVGQDVRRELTAPRPARVADSIQSFHPDDWLVVYRRARGMLPP